MRGLVIVLFAGLGLAMGVLLALVGEDGSDAPLVQAAAPPASVADAEAPPPDTPQGDGDAGAGGAAAHVSLQSQVPAVGIPAERDGHFYTVARVNGVSVRFMIDTGATMLVLSRGDARKAGVVVTDRDFTDFATTVQGRVRVAPVVLRDLTIGDIRVHNVEALVTEGRSRVSLLGMSVLRRLRGYEVRGGTMYLYR